MTMSKTRIQIERAFIEREKSKIWKKKSPKQEFLEQLAETHPDLAEAQAQLPRRKFRRW